MGAMDKTSITYVVKNQRRGGNSKVMNRVSLAFGDSSATYPTGGIPIITGNCGCPNTIESMVIADSGTSGYTFNYNSGTGKLQMYQLASHTHDIKAIGGLTSSEALLLDASVKFGKNAATDRTVAGSTSATTGGVVANAAVGDGEIANTVAPAALTLIVEVIGW